MINDFLIATVTGAIIGGAGAWVSHRIANKRRWDYVIRYVCGGFIVLAGFSIPAAAVLDAWLAVALICALGAVFAATGVTTFLAHDADHQRDVAGVIEQAEQINERLRSELDK